jgi:NADH-quinone oxidoreductase subunit M
LILPLVSITLFLPLLGSALLVLMRGSTPRVAHGVGIVTSGLTLVGAVWV